MSFEAPREYERFIELSEDLLFELLKAMTLDGKTKSFRIIRDAIPPDARNVRVQRTLNRTIILRFDTWEDGPEQISPVMQTNDERSALDALRKIKKLVLETTGGLNEVSAALQAIAARCREGGATENLDELREIIDGDRATDPRIVPGGRHVDAEVTTRIELENTHPPFP